MPRPPNYGQQRAERSRAARSKAEDKQRALQERTERRKAAREAEQSVGPEQSDDRAERDA